MILESIIKIAGRCLIEVQCDHCSIIMKRSVSSIAKSRIKRGNNLDLCKHCATVYYNKTRPMEVKKKCGQAVKDKHKGKKLEEIVGEKRASSIRKLLSFQRMGEKNHNYQGRHQKFPIRTGTYEEQFGEEKAKVIKKKLSLASSGSNNPMYGKPSPKRSGCGISGHFRHYYFRSLLELSCILDMIDRGIKFESCDGRKNFKFNYDVDGIVKTYFPDFYLLSTDEFIEVKPSRQVNCIVTTLKAEAVKTAGCNFRFVTEKDISRIEKSALLEMIDSGEVRIDENKIRLVNR